LLELADGTWSGEDVDLGDVEDFDALVDRLSEAGPDGSTSVLFIEEDDEHLVIVRASGERDPHVFVADRRSLEGATIAARLLGTEFGTVVEDADAEESARPEVEPAGDGNLLADLGVNEDALLALCAEKGLLPADVIFEVCDRLGCGDVLEELRGV
jgi:putative tRNA adenosine deaminase-associated protein